MLSWIHKVALSHRDSLAWVILYIKVLVQVPKILRHASKKDPERNPNFENYPSVSLSVPAFQLHLYGFWDGVYVRIHAQ